MILSIRPIDILMAAPKSQEVSHYKHQESQKTFNEQTQIATLINQNVKHNSQQTVKTEKNEHRYDAKDKKNNSHSGKEQKKNKDNQDNRQEEMGQTSNFDIRI